MKKIVKITSLLLVLTLSLFAIACSSYGKVEKAFLDNGYSLAQEINDTSKAIKEDVEGLEIEAKYYNFIKSGLANEVLVIEFKAKDDLVKASRNLSSINLQLSGIDTKAETDDLYDSLVDAGYANGNCLAISAAWGGLGSIISDDYKIIMKNA